jgi:hypothetical protein
VARRDILLLPEDNDDKSKSGSKASKDFQQKMKKAGAALTQLSEAAEFDNDLFEEQSHAQLGVVEVTNGYSFATKSKSLSHHLLLDNQSSVSAQHVQSRLRY